MGLVDKIKQDVKKSGQNKGKFIYFREGQKIRVRFLTDMDDGMEVTFHDSYEQGINVPCQELFGRNCPYCEEEGLRTRSNYIWSVYNYETKEVQLFMFPVNNCSPIPALMAMYENYGTITDRDYVISVSGKQQNKTFSVVPMDKVKFRNEKAKAYSEKSILKMLDKAFPCDVADDDSDEDDDDDTSKKRTQKSADKKNTHKPEPDDDNDDDYDNEDLGEDDEDDADTADYSEMSAKELYNLCEDRGIEAEPKMKPSYYINLLEEYDEENSDSDDWEEEDEEVDYSEMTAKELYKLCQERDIEALPKKSEKYYINLLKENDKAHDDWEEDDSDEDEEDW